MKKIVVFISLFFTSILVTQAASCKVISGDGTNIGDEIQCGTENFYVLSNDGKSVKMMGKYNLLSGYIYDYIELDNYQYKSSADIYKNKEVQDRINEYGIYLSSHYTYDRTTGIYTATAASGSKYYTEDYKIVVLDTEFASEKELLNQIEIKEVLEQGYKISNILLSNSRYFGVIFYKDEAYDYKTLFLDGTNKTLGELMKTPEIKNLIEQGYSLENMYYDNMTESNNEYKYDYYAVTLLKTKYYDYITVILDEMVTYRYYNDFFSNYVENNELVQQKISEGYIFYSTVSQYYYSSGNENYYGIKLRKKTDYYSTTKQDEKAVGIRGSSRNPQYPFYGVFNRYDYYDIDESWNSLSEIAKDTIGEAYGGGYYQDFNVESLPPLIEYKKTLEDMGYTVNEVSMLTVQELNDITKELIGSELPLEEWYENRTAVKDEEGNIKTYILGNIKDFYNGKHEWIWSTSYWLGTMSPTAKIVDTYNSDIYDMNTLGDLCLTDSCVNSPSRGIRPVVTIPAYLIYKIETKTDGNGEVKADYVEAQGGTIVKFTVTPKEGYVLGEVKVTDKNGNVVIFTDYTFTMPNADVLIEATFVPEKPNTVDKISLLIITIFALGLVISHNNKKRISLN